MTSHSTVKNIVSKWKSGKPISHSSLNLFQTSLRSWIESNAPDAAFSAAFKALLDLSVHDRLDRKKHHNVIKECTLACLIAVANTVGDKTSIESSILCPNHVSNEYIRCLDLIKIQNELIQEPKNKIWFWQAVILSNKTKKIFPAHDFDVFVPGIFWPKTLGIDRIRPRLIEFVSVLEFDPVNPFVTIAVKVDFDHDGKSLLSQAYANLFAMKFDDFQTFFEF